MIKKMTVSSSLGIMQSCSIVLHFLVTDVQEYLLPLNKNGNDAPTDDEDDDVIDIPGGQADEADIETLVDELGLVDMVQGDLHADLFTDDYYLSIYMYYI